MVQCNLVIRKVLYTVKNRSCVGSRLSDIIVLVFHMYLHAHLLSNGCIWSAMFGQGILWTFLSMDKANIFVFYLLFVLLLALDIGSIVMFF